jgi:anoctamin-10
VTKLINDEFDLKQFLNDGILVAGVCKLTFLQTDHFPLHDFEEKRTIYQFWKKERLHILLEPFFWRKYALRSQNALSSYFSPEVGFFFVFLSFLTSWLLIPMLPGSILGIYIYSKNDKDNPWVPVYIIFLAVWGTIFFEFWKRKQNELAYELDMHIAKEQKKKIPQYKGEFTIEEVSHEIIMTD